MQSTIQRSGDAARMKRADQLEGKGAVSPREVVLLWVDAFNRTILEWKEPLGLRGCGLFRVRDGKIAFQRGYFDRQSFLEAQGKEAG